MFLWFYVGDFDFLLTITIGVNDRFVDIDYLYLLKVLY